MDAGPSCRRLTTTIILAEIAPHSQWQGWYCRSSAGCSLLAPAGFASLHEVRG